MGHCLPQLAIHNLLEIDGVARNRAQQEQRDLIDEIPNLRQFVLMRDRITHGYDSVDYSLVWRVATVDIPLLRQKVDWLLLDAPPFFLRDSPVAGC